eukprot:scaffold22216_cov44-Phaeocystis_antarctica.AAC.1
MVSRASSSLVLSFTVSPTASALALRIHLASLLAAVEINVEKAGGMSMPAPVLSPVAAAHISM